MNGYAFTLAGAELVALPSGALFWPAQGLLAVSDLHLGRAERMARRGGALLPPYETTDTLLRLEAEIAVTAPRQVVCLGDSFDDDAAAAALPEEVRMWLARLMAGRGWVWVTGNHDPAPPVAAGTPRAALALGPLTFRHIPEAAACGEVAGHYHPKLRLGLGGARASRPCFLIDAARVVMPAFGTYTGGLSTDAAALASLMGAGALAVMTGPQARPVPMPRRRAAAP